MKDSVLSYDKQIWTVFSIAAVSSVVIFYYSFKITDEFYQLMALVLGFSILLYCIFATWGYVKKKRLILKMDSESGKFSQELDKHYYSRSGWMAESILILIGIIYVAAFFKLGNWIYLLIPLSVLIFFMTLCLINNYLGKK